MQLQILYRPTYSMAVVAMEQGESVVAEAGAMVSMSDTLDIQTAARGGILKGLTRSLLGGETFFMNTFRAARGAGELVLAPGFPGDLQQLPVDGEMMFRSGTYLASPPSINIDTQWGGARSFFAGAGMVLLRASGTGWVLASSYGAIHEKQLAAGEKYIVDTGYIVAFDSSTSYNVRRLGGLKSTLFGGEGLVAEFTGPGRILLQSRSPESLVDWLAPLLPHESK